jgi:membrane fusion protein (multidrug efflux system)
MAKKEDHKKTRLAAVIVLSVIVIIAGGFVFYWYITFFHYISTDLASIESTRVSVASKMMGRVAAMSALEGDKVEAGQILVQLDDTDLKSQESQMVAALALAKQNSALVQVNLTRAEADFDRIKQIYSGGYSSKEQYDHAEKNLEAARVQYEIAQGQVDVAGAQLQVLTTQKANTKIAAPISGIISKKNVSPGEIVQPGQAIYVITNLNDIWVTANIEETKVRFIHVDMDAEITIDAFPDTRFKGRIAQIAAAIVPPPFTIGESTKTIQKIPVKIVFDPVPDSLKLLPGMSVEVRIKVK